MERMVYVPATGTSPIGTADMIVGVSDLLGWEVGRELLLAYEGGLPVFICGAELAPDSK